MARCFDEKELVPRVHVEVPCLPKGIAGLSCKVDAWIDFHVGMLVVRADPFVGLIRQYVGTRFCVRPSVVCRDPEYEAVKPKSFCSPHECLLHRPDNRTVQRLRNKFGCARFLLG